ncbi:HepT-like ribonuclease domain-containing protein [Flammeovirga pacifica]|uniref:Antitoxin n=1 Tax=Flammeovirga pacifica TaxID=915059 RepID=A0A1S1YX27_FLAPC|nr:HepT-like ribonuclease domain-containing protein [Flammeovirga pacifica]OHX65580.1 hypothetical protein NH26_04060 [Flammeovirga pacifica]
MDNRIQKWLFDIKISIDEIESYFATERKDFFNYKSNTMLKRAIERDLEIIGEAVNRIIKTDPKYINKISSAKRIVGLRNQVIHAYDNISDENIWSIIIKHLPILNEEVDNLIKSQQK